MRDDKRRRLIFATAAEDLELKKQPKHGKESELEKERLVKLRDTSRDNEMLAVRRTMNKKEEE